MSNKLRTLSLSILSCTAILLSGCNTMHLWQDTQYVTKEKKSSSYDTVYAFAQANSSSQHIQKDSLVMIGDKYLYALPPYESKEYLRILRSKLSKPFTISEYNGTSSVVRGSQMKLDIADGSGGFYTNFCLNYNAASSYERSKLRRLGFQRKDDSRYQRCLKSKGKYFSAAQYILVEYRFANPIKVELEKKTTVTEYDESGKMIAVALTPIALAVDVFETLMFLDEMFNPKN